MRYFSALLVLAAVSGCSFKLSTNGDDGASRGGTEEEPWDMRTRANEEGCFPEAVASQHALCLCEGLNEVGSLHLLESDDGLPASLGINGVANLVNDTYIEGSLHAQTGLDAVSEATVLDDIITSGNFNFVGSQHVRGDLLVGGNLDGVGAIAVDGTLRLGGQALVLGDLDAPRRGNYEAPADPCGCRGDGYFSVATAVSDAAVINDNARIGLEEKIDLVNGNELLLPSGRYYLDSWTSVGGLRVVAEGHVALFVGGSMTQVGASQLTVADGGSLDVYVAGNVESVGALDLGGDDPSAFRLFVGGDDPVIVGVGAQTITGHVYAPRARVELVGDTDIVGSLFARSLDGVGDLTIRYGGPTETHEETCEEIPLDEAGEPIPPDLY